MVNKFDSICSTLVMFLVSAIVAIGFAGLAVCLIIICCGVVCLHR